MTVSAELVFSQGASTGNPGQAFFATIGTGVGLANFNDAGVGSYTYALADVPVGSALAVGTISSGSSPTATFTPDVVGSYRVTLVVIGVDGSTASATSTVIVKTGRGWVLPAFLNDAAELNYPDPTNPNVVGWKDSLNTILADVATKGFFTDTSLGASPTNVLTWSGTAWAPAAAGGGGVTWANDLAGSSSTTQQVAALTKSTLIPVTTGFKIGTNPAQTGLVGLPNNVAGITGRNAANNADVAALAVNASNQVVLGGTNAAGLLGNVGATTTMQLANATTDFLKLGAPTATGTAYSSTGLLRFGDINVSALTLLGSRNSANTADAPVISTDGAGTYIFGNTVNAVETFLSGLTACRMTVASTYVFRLTSATLQSIANTQFSALSAGGPFAFDSDAGLTEWDHKINGTTIMVVDTAKVRTKKGISRAVRRVATSTTLTTADDIVIFSATTQIATLPASPTTGDKYSVGLGAASITGSVQVAGNGNNIILSGASNATIGFTTSATASQVYSFVYDGVNWVAAPGY